MDLLAPAIARVAEVESAAADALAPAEEVRVDGWRLRFHHGVTRRGNSVLPERRGRRPLAWKIDEATAWMRDRGIVPRFQLTPSARPRRLDADLAARGWRHEAGARMLYRSTAAPFANAPAAGLDLGATIRIGGEPDADYRTVQHAVTPAAAAWAAQRAHGVVGRGLAPWHMVLSCEGTPVSAALAVHDPERRLVGVFALATVPAARGRGHATQLLRTVHDAASRAGAEGIYLQVAAGDGAALRLYAREGFAEHHRYHYRVLDDPPP